MKKQTTTLFLRLGFSLALMLTVSLFLASCSDDDAPPQQIEAETEDLTLPPVDSMKVRTMQRTYVFPYDYGRTGAALVSRVFVKAPALDSTVATVVLHDGCVPSLSRLDYRGVASLVARGGNVVYCDPTRQGVDAFLRNLRAIGLEMFDEGALRLTEDGYHACRNILHIKEDATGKLVPSFIDNDDTNGILCDIVAFRGNEKYVVADLDENRAVQTLASDSTAAPLGDSATEEADGLPLQYMYGVHADKVAEWLDDDTDDANDPQEVARLLRAAANGAEMDIDKYAKAQEEQYSFNVYAGHKFAPVTVTYYVWAVYDNKGADYYLFHQEIALESSKLVCGPKSEKGWNVYKVAEAFKGLGEDLRAYWAYMTGMSAEVSFSDNAVEMSNVSPANDISGQTSYKESVEWSLNSGFVASANPHMSISGGVKMNKEWTHSIPDLKLTYKRNKNKPKWQYTAGVLPKAWLHRGVFGVPTGWRHDQAKDILSSDCEVGHTWIWKIKDAKNTYSFKTDMQVDLQGMWVERNGSKKGYKTFTNKNSKTITLLAPPRYEQEWIMRMTPNNKEAFESLEKTFKNYWVENFSLYTVEKNDRKAIDSWIRDLKEVIEKNPQSISNVGLGEFTLTWKPLKESADYKSYTYKPGK